MKVGTCKHFNGAFHNPCCGAGVRYDDVIPEPTRQRGKLLRLPCHQTLGFDKPSETQVEEFAKRGTCAKYEDPTPADIAEHERQINKVVARHMKAMGVIQKVKKAHKGKDWKGVEACPVCGGNLHMMHAAFNGHVWGQCETKDCLSWME